ncbi:MAG: HAMP domain-containing sensor histidine kinase [Flavobacteriales bacterium]
MKATSEQAERLHRFAHDLRNRLIGLQQVLEQLGQGDKDPERSDIITFGEQQYFKALREVEVLLDDLGVDRGSIEPTLAPTPLAPLVRQNLDMMQHRFTGKQQTLVIDLDESAVVIADGRVTGDILSALFSNASKFSHPKGKIAVRSITNGGEAILEVKDEGTGLDPDDLQQLFTRFAWLGNRPTGNESQGRGTLARMRDWARAQQGELSATSSGVGQGCTFTLRLPLA